MLDTASGVAWYPGRHEFGRGSNGVDVVDAAA